ncbi:hypothetical protein SD77_2889 [Bacillus badius]|uniref:Uncharacterized protein n=1 Tax=Bacillus badius TaxID=1455 RepID=A0ABR5APH8_BACBA|nr:hypothetical protein SD77_2889 [Bacillus badius]
MNKKLISSVIGAAIFTGVASFGAYHLNSYAAENKKQQR